MSVWQTPQASRRTSTSPGSRLRQLDLLHRERLPNSSSTAARILIWRHSYSAWVRPGRPGTRGGISKALVA